MERKVTAVIGALPEVEGFALARFSRSKPDMSFADWILTLSQERAESFYDQFYHKYGHASIADLAHVGVSVENISIVAAIALLDEPLLDAQERSTRYIDFARATYHTPDEIKGSPFEPRYADLCDRLLEEYRFFHVALVEHLARKHGAFKPHDLDDKGFNETVKAKAFDIARYLLPSSTLTGAGFIASGRTLERHIRRLLCAPSEEIRSMAAEMKKTLTQTPALNPIETRLRPVLDAAAVAPDVRKQIDFHTYKDCVPLPTLVKHAEPSPYLKDYRVRLEPWAFRKLGALPPPDRSRGVELSTQEALPNDLAISTLYAFLPHSYRQISDITRGKAGLRDALIAEALDPRGPHDDSPREFAGGFTLTFDLCMDNGSFRDLHRHRNLVQVLKPFDHRLGYDTPDEIQEAGLHDRYHQVHQQVLEFAQDLFTSHPRLVEYALPLSFRRRALFKMTFRELQYIVELRSKPAGHFSYRDIAIRMFDAFAQTYPTLAKHIRVSRFQPQDFFVR